MKEWSECIRVCIDRFRFSLDGRKSRERKKWRGEEIVWGGSKGVRRIAVPVEKSF